MTERKKDNPSHIKPDDVVPYTTTPKEHDTIEDEQSKARVISCYTPTLRRNQPEDDCGDADELETV